MLNKIKVIGEVLPIEIKNRDNLETERREANIYFSLKVPTPSGSLTILRCLARGKLAERVEQEISGGEVIELWGYLRNEKMRMSRQILIRAINFDRLELKPEEIDKNQAIQVRLIGKINNFESIDRNETNSSLLSFRIFVPREEVIMIETSNDSEEFKKRAKNLSNFFCRVQGELVPQFKEQVKENDIILLEGFLQTVKKVTEDQIDRISSVICTGFTRLDSDAADTFSPLGKSTHWTASVKEINFDKFKCIECGTVSDDAKAYKKHNGKFYCLDCLSVKVKEE